MKRIVRWSLSIAAPLALLPVSAWAQEPIEAVKAKAAVEAKAQVEVAKMVGTQFSVEAKVTKGAPYSATAESETVQMMLDGNRIHNKTTQIVYRDTEGRTRREMMGKTPDTPVQVFINDPVNNLTYTLNPQQRTATKAQRMVAVRVAESRKAVEQTANVRVAESSGQVLVSGQPLKVAEVNEKAALEQKLRQAQEVAAVRGQVTGGFGGGVMVKQKPGSQESLGQQMIEGVMCEGKRTTVTIPAGSIGNDLPINIVSEEWYSPELQVLVLTKHSDPRFGETTYRLTNINRSEPARSLFELPADYTVRDTMAPAIKLKREEQ